ncbi:hypothetical protein CEY15_16115 [Dietzia natronolimnaea]|uniref:Uncharacterized protein n=1 Tax=Dietzia natronolimnaea TaxID=161920 RepID=A0A2A2WL94_9ACTN|nr:leucine-rich repeat protein [Dietzia natronolimnaea]PAY21962.1 hypothetical protein CEY15_16115 [Dietzia natronolimnaea]
MTCSQPTVPSPARRLLVPMLAVVLVSTAFMALAAAPARAARLITVGGITYSVDTSAPGSEATAASYEHDAGTDVTIPASITVGGTEYPVTTIGDLAFMNHQLTSVTLPSTLTTIGDSAFAHNVLTTVVVPPAVTTIGRLAFVDNPKLTTIRFTGPAPLTFAGDDQPYTLWAANIQLTVEFRSQYLAAESWLGFTTPKWVGYRAIPAYSISFATGDGPAVDPVTVWPGEVPELPTPARQGYTFTGWYTSPDSDTLVDPRSPLTADITAHAGWRPVETPVAPSTPAWTSLAGGSLNDFLRLVLQPN